MKQNLEYQIGELRLRYIEHRLLDIRPKQLLTLK
jgi:hypothetical protein